MTHARRVATLVGVAILVSAATGCSATSENPDAEVATGDALNLGVEEGSICMPTPGEDDLVYGDTLLHHEAQGPVTISDVSLVGAVGMVLRDAYLVHVRPGEDLVGFRRASDESGLPRAWGQRVDAVGSVVGQGEVWNLVLVVASPTVATASAEAASVRYEYDGEQFQQRTRTKMITTTGSCDEALGFTDVDTS